MDCQGGGILIGHKPFVLAALIALGSCAAGLSSRTLSSAPAMPELIWFPAGADRVAALTQEPASCLVPAKSPWEAEQVRIGEIIFNSPALLGGQAEKKGLSCGSCHRNGRGNPQFQFEAVSGAPGTADVTSGLFSQIRADDIFNPLPIPDLALPEGQNQVDRSDAKALEDFVRGQIVEEFSGDTPPRQIMDALLTYLVHIDADDTCASNASLPVTWTDDWTDARTAAELAQALGNPQSHTFFIRTARLSLGRLHARYTAPEHAVLREQLVSLSRELGNGGAWPQSTAELSARLEQGAARSLYNPEALTVYLTQQR